MRILTLTLIATGLALSGCGEKAGGGGSILSDGPTQRQAGSWKSSVTLEKFEVPGAPPEMKAMMQKMMTAAGTQELCLSKEAAAKDDIAASLAKSQARDDCTFTKKEVRGGRLNVAGTCKDKAGETITMAIAGSVAATKTDVNMDISGSAPTGGTMTMVMNVKSERTGECKTGQAAMPS